MNPAFRIEFEKPNLKKLIKHNTVVDLHFHSHYSDGSNTIPEIVRHARKLGIGIAITDHNEIKGAVEMDQHKEVLNIPGIEITSREGTHLIVYFYDIESLKEFYHRDIQPRMGNGVMSSTSLKMEEVIDRARDFKSVIIFPHPTCAAYTGICNSYFSKKRQQLLFNQVDGVEVINSGNLKKWNLKCALLGFNLGRSVTGGSDGHMLKHMGRAVTYINKAADRETFLDSVKNRQTRVIGKEIDIFRKVTSNGFRLKSNLKNYPDLVEKNLKYSYSVINLKSRKIKDNVRRSINERWRKWA